MHHSVIHTSFSLGADDDGAAADSVMDMASAIARSGSSPASIRAESSTLGTAAAGVAGTDSSGAACNPGIS